MTTLQSGNRKISIRFSTTTSETKNMRTRETTYVVTSPTIICNNEEDANKIQTTIDKFVSNLVKDILKR